MTASDPLPLPAFFDPANAASWTYRPDAARLSDAASELRRAHGIRPSGEDAETLHLLLIDVQKDFCLPEGSLFVAGRTGDGAIADSARLAAFVHRNLARITSITATLDTHVAHQIFFPSFWVDRDGQPPSAHREVTSDDVEQGRLRPSAAVAAWLTGGDVERLARHALHYCRSLERAGKYRLYLWPPHCLVGGDGHTLVGVVQEARLFHAYARGTQSWTELKGGNPLTENYSVLRPEVLDGPDGAPIATRNDALLRTLLAADRLVVAGQASSHCVKSSVDDLLDEIVSVDPSLARRVYVLVDCMSAVTVPDGQGGLAVDFTPQADAAQARWAEAGVHLVRSTDPVNDWPR